MQRKKINWISILQGWAMLWVVVGHSFIGSANHPEMWPLYVRVLYKFAYSFHMALFMFTSGYLFFMTRLADGENKWPYQKVIIDKAKRLLLPGIVFSLLAFILKIAFPAEMSRKVGKSGDRNTDLLHPMIVRFGVGEDGVAYIGFRTNKVGKDGTERPVSGAGWFKLDNFQLFYESEDIPTLRLLMCWLLISLK